MNHQTNMSLNEARETVLQFELAIRRLDSLIKLLNQNASDVKTTIHAGVIQNLECLWGREIRLLSQVDEVHKVKEQTLQHQQTRLSHALGVLQTVLSMAVDGTASERHLVDTLEKLKRMELTPEESPYISFQADANLLESILNYGQVDGNGLPLMSASDYAGNVSASVQCHVEEYMDVEHHVLLKTAEEVKKVQTSACNINITIPKLSNRTEDWLQKKAPLSNSSICDNNIPVGHLPFTCPSMLSGSGNMPSVGLSSTSASDNWPILSKQNVDLQDENDITDNSCSQKAATETRSPRVAEKSHGNVSAAGDNMKYWLSNTSVCPSSFSSTMKHIPTNDSFWLLQTGQQWNSLNDQKQKDFFQHVSKETSSWLHSQPNSKHVTFPAKLDRSDFFSHISKDKDCWLQRQKNADAVGTNEHKADRSGDAKSSCCRRTCLKESDEKWLSTSATSTALQQLKNVCRANELCENISECVSQPDCFTLLFREKFPVKNVIDPAKAFKPLSLQQQEWLSPASHQGSVTDQSQEKTSDLFRPMQDTSDSMWLMKPALSTAVIANTTPSSSVKFKDGKEETNLWLQKTGSTSLLDSVRSSSVSSNSSMSDWLMVTAEDKIKLQQMFDLEKESEGWSICSDSHSTNTDQCAQDIAAAEEYFRKWLL